MAETRSFAYINESLSLLKTTTDHHGHSLQEINKQLNAISLALQKLTEVEEQRLQQPMSSKSSSPSPNARVVSLPISHMSKSVRLDFPRFKGDDPASWVCKSNQYFSFYQTPFDERLLMA